MSFIKICSNEILKLFRPNFQSLKRCMFECGEKEHTCQSNKCRKKHAPCRDVPVSSPEEKRAKEWATEKSEEHDRLIPLSPRKFKNAKCCSNVPKLSSESTNNQRKAHCCFPNKQQKTKLPKSK